MTYTLAQQYEDDERDYDFLITYVKALKAELAALRPKRCRCWTCRYHVHLSHGGNAYQYPECPLYGEDFEADGLCHRWQARP